MNKNILIAIAGIVVLALGVYVFAAFFQAPAEAPQAPSAQLQESDDEVVSTSTAETESPELTETENKPEPIAYTEENTERFVVPRNASFSDTIDALYEDGFIKNKTAFTIAWTTTGAGDVAAGAYRLSPQMDAFTTARVLHDEPYMKWVVVPEGLRKEEIATLLADTLGWSDEQKTAWVDTYTAMQYDHIEGVYFPDTYLIPIDEDPRAVAERLIAKFNEKFAPYLPQFNAQNIKWTTGLTLASLVQRESSSDEDMPLIAGILWNRLEQNMYLNVDATLQYVRGNTGNGWWAPISVADKEIDSPYNTYLYRGLPPRPIANPGIAAIEAVLYPLETTCLYYLHDNDGATHCADTYEEHLENIEQYLK